MGRQLPRPLRWHPARHGTMEMRNTPRTPTRVGSLSRRPQYQVPATSGALAGLRRVRAGAQGAHMVLRAAHERNDEVLERIYIGRRFQNDTTERLEKFFELYIDMSEATEAA